MSGTHTKESSPESLVLVFNPAGDSSNKTYSRTSISTSLKEQCNYWVLLDNNKNGTALKDIRDAMNGVSGKVLGLTDSPGVSQSECLAKLLQGKSSHLLILQPGVVVESDLNFQPGSGNTPEQILHQSPSRKEGLWKTVLVPNVPEAWRLDGSRNVVVNSFAQVIRNNSISVVDQNYFPRSRSPDPAFIDVLIDDYKISPTSKLAMAVADALLLRQVYGEALNWLQSALKDNPAPSVQWLAHYRSSYCLQKLEADWIDIETHLAAAFDVDPDRMEPLYHLLKHYNEIDDPASAYALAAIADQIAEPPEGTHFELEIYRYRFSYEYASACLQLKNYSKCIEIVSKALRTTFIPEIVRRDLATLRARAYEQIYPVYPVRIHKNNRLLIVIAFRNAGEFLGKCISSIQQQQFSTYKVILIDDASSDGALAALGDLGERFITIVNDKRLGALHNQTQAIREHAINDDIVVHLDGDDWLANDGALQRINDFFNRTRCWLMYGQFENSLGAYGSCEPIIPNGEPLLGQLTKMHFPMHIRAYRAGVFFDLLRQDPGLDVLKAADGSFLDAISDLALMRALIQIAGSGKTRYNEEILYIYNRSNPESHYQTRDKVALQKRQSAIAASKPLLKQASNENITGSSAPIDEYTKTIFFALDGMTPSLIQKWSEQGHLPNLARLLKNCRLTKLRCPEAFGNDAFWNTLCTGSLPDETGYYFRVKVSSDNYQTEYHGPAEQVKKDCFWVELSESDVELAIIDLPEVKHGGLINGLEISEWLPHARYATLASCPEELSTDVLERFGNDPFNGSTERSTPRSDLETEHDLNLLLELASKKTRAAKHYLKRGGWDFFAIGYQQAHDAGHQFWHLHDPEHPRFSKEYFEKQGDPLLKVYQRIDEGIGELMELAGKNVKLIMVAGLSMQSKVSCNSILDQILWEIDVHDRRQNGLPFPDMDELEQRRFYAVPHNNLSGAIRFNLVNREASGKVEKGLEYDETVAFLKHHLAKLINSETGDAIISEIITVHEDYSGSVVNELPDLFLLWNRESIIREVSSPYFEPIKLRIRWPMDTRSGDHVAQATLYSNLQVMTDESGEINVEDISSRIV
ncbi:MAG: alkaline phosphatase family protein, partial [Gammaproteobacteria bacterium]|nr:alkaline phosphatase family protein [Gammaproteobacteria bacterium]